jgi:hypothetical protein
MSTVKCQVYSCSNFLKFTNSIKNKNNGCQSQASKQRYRYVCAWCLTCIAVPELIPLSCRRLIAMSKVKCQVYSCSNFLKFTNSMIYKNTGCQSLASKAIAISGLHAWCLTCIAVPELIPLSCRRLIAMSKVKCQLYSYSNFLKFTNSMIYKNTGCQSLANKGIAMCGLHAWRLA